MPGNGGRNSGLHGTNHPMSQIGTAGVCEQTVILILRLRTTGGLHEQVSVSGRRRVRVDGNRGSCRAGAEHVAAEHQRHVRRGHRDHYHRCERHPHRCHRAGRQRQSRVGNDCRRSMVPGERRRRRDGGHHHQPRAERQRFGLFRHDGRRRQGRPAILPAQLADAVQPDEHFVRPLPQQFFNGRCRFGAGNAHRHRQERQFRRVAGL